MSLLSIYKNLGLQPNLGVEIRKFNFRLGKIIEELDLQYTDDFGNYNSILLDKLSFSLGIEHSRIWAFFDGGSEEKTFKGNIFRLSMLLDITGNNRLLIAPSYRKKLIKQVEEIFNLSLLDLGYSLSGGEIIKKGAGELDEKLLKENLSWLKKFPDAREKFSNGLRFFLTKDYSDSITNVYSSLEGVAKVVLNKNTRLDNEKTIKELISTLGLSGHWGQILFNYCKIAHEFSSRHGKNSKSTNPKLHPEEVEFYIYFTGTVIRLISQKFSTL